MSLSESASKSILHGDRQWGEMDNTVILHLGLEWLSHLAVPLILGDAGLVPAPGSSCGGQTPSAGPRLLLPGCLPCWERVVAWGSVLGPCLRVFSFRLALGGS